jgi:hypothetical protein
MITLSSFKAAKMLGGLVESMQVLKDCQCVRWTCHATSNIQGLASEKECPPLRCAAMLGQRFHIEQFADRHAESCQKNGMKKETLGSYSQYNGQSQTGIIWMAGLMTYALLRTPVNRRIWLRCENPIATRRIPGNCRPQDSTARRQPSYAPVVQDPRYCILG